MDPELQARFVERMQAHQGAIRRVAALYARDAADRQDLFQEIALQLWRAFPSFRGDSAFSTFLFRVALNTALMRARSASRRPPAETGRALEDLAAREQPVEPGERDDEVERLYAATRRLQPLDRALVLLVLEERRHEEIAAVTGLSAGNVGVRLHRARARLREILGATESAPPHPPTARDAPCSTRS